MNYSPTHARPKIRRGLHLDMQILIHLANHLNRMANSKMRVLKTHRARTTASARISTAWSNRFGSS